MKKQNLALLVVVRSANKSGTAKTYIRITIDGNETECYLGQIIPKQHWNNDFKRCEETCMKFQMKKRGTSQVRFSYLRFRG